MLTTTGLPLEFLSGREMGARLRTSAETVLAEARSLLEALAACVSVRPK